MRTRLRAWAQRLTGRPSLLPYIEPQPEQAPPPYRDLMADWMALLGKPIPCPWTYTASTADIAIPPDPIRMPIKD